jgi:flavin-dependent dehydrogenase
MFDVIVAGGGPGGCATAIAAARAGLRVLLLERGQFPRHKVCGEFVSAESLRLLSTLLADEGPELLQRSVAIQSAESFIDGRSFVARLCPPARSITRHAMDEALWHAAQQAGVTALEKTAVHDVAVNGKFDVSTSRGILTGRSFINASGRWSTLDRRPLSGPRLIGLKAHYFTPVTPTGVQLYFFDGGYCGVQPIGPDRVNVCAMVRSEIATNLDEVFALEPSLWAASRGWKVGMQPVATSPLVFRKPEPSTGHTLNVGDAAAFIDPFVGDGISLALHSGRLAAESLVHAFGTGEPKAAAERYRVEYERRFAPAFRSSARVRGLLGVPRPLRRAALLALKAPFISERLIRATRVRLGDD